MTSIDVINWCHHDIKNFFHIVYGTRQRVSHHLQKKFREYLKPFSHINWQTKNSSGRWQAPRSPFFTSRTAAPRPKAEEALHSAASEASAECCPYLQKFKIFRILWQTLRPCDKCKLKDNPFSFETSPRSSKTAKNFKSYDRLNNTVWIASSQLARPLYKFMYFSILAIFEGLQKGGSYCPIYMKFKT